MKHRIFSCSVAILTSMSASYLSLPSYAGNSTNIQRIPSIVPEIQLEAAEHKWLAKTFPRDPLTKRLQRLELVVYGATQFGTPAQRWAELQESLSLDQSNQAKPSNEQREILAIERQVLKRTFPSEGSVQRLNRLEAKVFGKPTPNLSVAQRIDRLNKITSINQESGDIINLRPFGAPFENMPGFGQLDPQMLEMLQEMQRQMQQFNNGPRGKIIPNLPPNGQFHFYYESPEDSHSFDYPPRSGEEIPEQPDLQKPQKLLPGIKSPNLKELPPYNDPNFI